MSRGPRSPREEVGTDAERDAWLREALRHAPDASASAPPGVRDAILRQARQAMAAAATTGRDTRPGPRASWWSWLMQPSVAAGFASVMVATLVGVMWWGRPIDEPLRETNLPDTPTRGAAPSTAPATATATAQATPAAPAKPAAAAAPTPPAAPAPPAAAAGPAAPTVPAAAPPPLPPRAQASTRPVPPHGAARPKATSPDNQALRTEERAAEKERRSARTMADESTRREAFASDGARGSPAPVAPTSVAPATVAPTPVSPAPALPATAGVTAAAPAEHGRDGESAGGTRSARPAAAALADSATDSATSAAANMPSAKATPSRLPAQPSAEPSPTAARAQAPARDTGAAPGAAVAELSRAPRPASEPAASPVPAANPLAHLRSAVAGAPGAWSWQRDGGPELPMNDAVQAWLGRLDDATRSGWQAGPAVAGSATQTLRLLRDGRLHTTLRIEAGAVRLESAAQASVPRAPLRAATVEALAAALEQATR